MCCMQPIGSQTITRFATHFLIKTDFFKKYKNIKQIFIFLEEYREIMKCVAFIGIKKALKQGLRFR